MAMNRSGGTTPDQPTTERATTDQATTSEAEGRAATDQAAVLLFHSLADPARLAIIRLLGDEERRVVDLTRELGLAQSTVSGHLACLRSAGLIDAHPHGRSTYYALARPELWPLLAAAEEVLDAGGSEAALCPEHHRPEPVAVCSAAVRGCVLHGNQPEGIAHGAHDRAGSGYSPGTHGGTHSGQHAPPHSSPPKSGPPHAGPSARPGRH